jgi:5'-phosphate synthase pdxT subunit
MCKGVKVTTIGVLAIQGAVEEHVKAIEKVGMRAREIRLPEEIDYDELDGLILPGGESTTMAIVGEATGLFPALKKWVESGRPIWGTCAGMILLSDHAIKQKGGGQALVGGLDVKICRNYFGAQLDSMEVNIPAPLLPTVPSQAADAKKDKPYKAIFIRAPAILSIGPKVQSIASIHAKPHHNARAEVEAVYRESEGEASVKRRKKSSSSVSESRKSTATSDETFEVHVAVRQGNILATAFHPELTDDLRWMQGFIRIVEEAKR